LLVKPDPFRRLESPELVHWQPELGFPAPVKDQSAGIVKGGRLTQVSIARSFSEKIFDEYKALRITAQNLRADWKTCGSKQSISQFLMNNLTGSTTSSSPMQSFDPNPYRFVSPLCLPQSGWKSLSAQPDQF